MLTTTVELIRDQVSEHMGKNPQLAEGHFLRVRWEIVEVEKEPA